MSGIHTEVKHTYTFECLYVRFYACMCVYVCREAFSSSPLPPSHPARSSCALACLVSLSPEDRTPMNPLAKQTDPPHHSGLSVSVIVSAFLL